MAVIMKELILSSLLQVFFDKLTSGLILVFARRHRIHKLIKNWRQRMSSSVPSEIDKDDADDRRLAVDLAREVNHHLLDHKETMRKILANKCIPCMSRAYERLREKDNIRLQRRKSNKVKLLPAYDSKDHCICCLLDIEMMLEKATHVPHDKDKDRHEGKKMTASDVVELRAYLDARLEEVENTVQRLIRHTTETTTGDNTPAVVDRKRRRRRAQKLPPAKRKRTRGGEAAECPQHDAPTLFFCSFLL